MNPQESTHEAAEPMLQWLVSEIAAMLDIAPKQIDVEADFDEFGLDSVQAVALSGALSERLGQELSATLLYEHSSIRDLADYLSQLGEPRP